MKNEEPGIFPPAKVIKEAISFDDNQHSLNPTDLHHEMNPVDNELLDQIRKLMALGCTNEKIIQILDQRYVGINPEKIDPKDLANVDAPDKVGKTEQGYFDAENQDQGVLRSRNGTGGGMSESRITEGFGRGVPSSVVQAKALEMHQRDNATRILNDIANIAKGNPDPDLLEYYPNWSQQNFVHYLSLLENPPVKDDFAALEQMEEHRITDPRTRRLAGLPALKEGVNSRLLQQDLKTALMNLSRRGLTLPEIKSMVEQTLLEIEPLVVTASPEDSMDLAAGQRDQ